MSTEQRDINWNDVIKKEARGKNDEDLGEVQEVGDTYVLVQKGLISKEKFYIPRDKVESYDGTVLRFTISEEDARSEYLGDLPSPLSTSVGNDNINNSIEDAEQKESESESTRVPLIEEKLNVSKREVTYKEASLIKEPVTETKTVEVPLTYEELIVERRPTEATTSQHELKPPVTAREEIKIPLKREEVEVKKEPYVKEEVVVKKRRTKERKTITEEAKSERLVDDTAEK